MMRTSLPLSFRRTNVTPAKAGAESMLRKEKWIPAFAGMTTFVLSLALALALALPAQAQVWRSLTIDRVLRDTAPLNVNVVFGEGSFDVRRSATEMGYSMFLQYDAERDRPRYQFDSVSRSLSLGTEKTDAKFSFGAASMGEARLELPAAVPANVTIDVGAASSTLELGGLSLRKLHFRTGASQTVLRFNEPNRVTMEEFVIDGSAGSVKATGLGNARASRIDIQAQVGTVDLDFSGEWTGDMIVDLRIVVAAATISVPRDVRVQIESSRVLSSFAPAGFERTGDTYRSDNWASAGRTLTIRAHSILGRIGVERSAPSK